MSLVRSGESLVDIPIFADIPPDSVKELCARGRVASFDAGHLLFERGRNAVELMILQDGIVELLFPVSVLGATREVAMESKRPGDIVAWSALVNPYHFTLSARCVSRCTLTCLTRDAIHGHFDTDPATGYRFMSNLSGVIGRRLQAMQTMWMHDLQANLANRLE